MKQLNDPPQLPFNKSVNNKNILKLYKLALIVLNKLHDPMHTKGTHGYGAVAASAYPVEEVSGSPPGRVIIKTLKIVPTATLFGAEHIRVGSHNLLTLGSPGHGLRSQMGWLPSGAQVMASPI
jgi:hypothetical protein